MKKIYFDHNATTSIAPEVLQVMIEVLQGPPSNPSSPHQSGRHGRAQLLRALDTVAQFFDVTPQEVFFTSGGTESINWMLRSLPPQSHIVTTSIEHAAVYETILSLEKHGMKVSYIPVDDSGIPSMDAIEKALIPSKTTLVFSSVNGETGAMLDLIKLSDLTRSYNCTLLIDAVAHIGKEPFLNNSGVTAIAVSAHKFHGPPGIGLLIAKNAFPLKPFMTGGHQQFNKRAGTENLAAILGIAKALELIHGERQIDITTFIQSLKDRFEQELLALIPGLQINAQNVRRACNVSNLDFPSQEAEMLLMQLDLQGIACSHGSACSSGALELSRVLRHMNLSKDRIASSLRFSFARTNTEEEILEGARRIGALYCSNAAAFDSAK